MIHVTDQFSKSYQTELRRVAEVYENRETGIQMRTRFINLEQLKKVLEWFGQEMAAPPGIAASFREPISSWSR